MTKKTVFISDVHLGAGKKWDWFAPEQEGPHLEKFFQYVAQRKDVKELVLLGDLFDLWVCPHNEAPHTLKEILETHARIVEAVIKTAETMPVLYVNGNHDFQVTEEDIAKAFQGKVKHIGNVYRRGNIHAEHGHRHALFNNPDPKNGGPSRLPLGYYITRLHTSLDRTRSSRVQLVLRTIDELFQMAGPELLPESVFDVIKGEVERKYDSKVDAISMGKFGEDQCCAAVRERYRHLFNDWQQAKGFWQAVQMIMTEVNRLGSVADSLCRDGVNIVVFGHSHDTAMDKDSLMTKDRIYANCGYWCGFGEEDVRSNAHFVQTDGKAVELFRFNDGEVRREQREVIED